MTGVKAAQGRAKWAEGEYLKELAAAYRRAIDAAAEINQPKIVEEWERDLVAIQTASANAFGEAKALGYFGAQ